MIDYEATTGAGRTGDTSNMVRRQVVGLLASYCAAALPCGAALMIWVLAFSSASPLPEGVVATGLTIVLCAFWFAVAAALFVVPAVLVGYPIATIIVHRGRSLTLTIVSGAL
jgi:uncharacterized membrane protein